MNNLNYCPTIKGKAIWYRNPIRWWQERKLTKVMNILLQEEWKKGLGEKVMNENIELIKYGMTSYEPRKRTNP